MTVFDEVPGVWFFFFETWNPQRKSTYVSKLFLEGVFETLATDV